MGTQALVEWVHPDGRTYTAPDGSYSPKAGTGWTRAPIQTFPG